MAGVRGRWRIVRAAVLGNVRAARFWRSVPDNRFTRDGYEVIESFLDRDECTRLVGLAERLLQGPGRVVAGDCYTWVKSEAAHGRNQGVRELVNVQSIDDAMAELVRSRRIQELFEARVGRRVELNGLGIQLDAVDTSTKRDFHVDSHFPPLFKAFVYLVDVDVDGDGPYTIVSGSHRWFVRKVVNDVFNACTSGTRRDMRLGIPRRRTTTVLAQAGTIILSTQDAVHKGWSDHWRRTRYALIAYGTVAEHFVPGPLREGLDGIREQATVAND